MKDIAKHLKIYGGIFAAVVILLIQPFSFKMIDSSELGIKYHNWDTDKTKQGGVEGTCKGWVLYNSWTSNIYTYPSIVQYKQYLPFKVTAKDGTIFRMDSVRLAYHIDPAKVCEVFVKYRKPLSEIEEGYIKTCISEAYRICGNSFSSDSLMSNRKAFENTIRAQIDKSMGLQGFIVDEFTQQIDPPASLVEMIDAKNRAVQSALKAENEVKEAEANAKIAIAKARGNAEAKRIAADAEAYANAKISNSITPTLVNKMWVEKWDGQMPTTMAGSNSMFMIGK